jgi:hypothetical protein
VEILLCLGLYVVLRIAVEALLWTELNKVAIGNVTGNVSGTCKHIISNKIKLVNRNLATLPILEWNNYLSCSTVWKTTICRPTAREMIAAFEKFAEISPDPIAAFVIIS